MLNIAEQIDLSSLSIEAQHELYDFYLFLKHKQHQNLPKNQERRIKRLHELKVQSLTPLTRDETYEKTNSPAQSALNLCQQSGT